MKTFKEPPFVPDTLFSPPALLKMSSRTPFRDPAYRQRAKKRRQSVSGGVSFKVFWMVSEFFLVQHSAI